MTKKDWRVAARKKLEQIVETLGGQAVVARAVGITQQAVSEIMRKGSIAPSQWVLPLERASGVVGLRHVLRPDLYPKE